MQWGAIRLSIRFSADALPGGFGVVDGVAGAAVEEALVPSGGAGGEIVLFHEEGGDAAQGQIARDARPRCAAADDQDFRLQIHPVPPFERDRLPREMTTSLMYYVNLLTGFIALVKANEP